MIKTVIFDLDNTLLMWKQEYISSIYQVLQEINFPYTDDMVRKIDESFESYEKCLDHYNDEIFLDFVNDFTGLSLPKVFVEKIKKVHESCYDMFTDSQLAVLDYLYNKYDLVVLTNWFTETQTKRLENAGILKYFKKVSGGDQHILKPYLKAFDIVDDHEHCVMIGDSMENDIKPALQLGMKAIMITDKEINDENVIVIRKLEDLMEVL